MTPWSSLLPILLLLVTSPSQAGAVTADPVLRVVSGVTEAGDPTDLWLAMIRKRLPRERYDAIAPLRKPLTAEEREWAGLIRARVGAWEREIPALAEVFRPIVPPSEVLIVIGNRGAEDAFTHDPTTIGFDLAALQANYGDAGLADNKERMDRFFRHEFVHLLQKAWLAVHPWVMDSPLRTALAEIWPEGLGNYQSLSARWQSRDGRRSDAAARALAELEPRFVARLSALACSAPEAAAVLTADLSWGRFDRKWGALTAALWLEEEREASAEALRNFVMAGPGGVWDLADRHLPEPLRAVLEEAREADSLCMHREPSRSPEPTFSAPSENNATR